MVLSDWIRWPHGVLHLQPRLRHLLLGGVLLPAVHHHPAGLHSHLRLPQDEAEEDRLWPGQRQSAAGLSSTISGEKWLFNYPINTDPTPRFSRKAFPRATAALSSTAPVTKSEPLRLNFQKSSIFPLPDEDATDLTWSHYKLLILPLSPLNARSSCYKSPPYLSPGHQTGLLPLQESACPSPAARSPRPRGHLSPIPRKLTA